MLYEANIMLVVRLQEIFIWSEVADGIFRYLSKY